MKRHMLTTLSSGGSSAFNPRAPHLVQRTMALQRHGGGVLADVCRHVMCAQVPSVVDWHDNQSVFFFFGLFGCAQPWLCWFVGGFDCAIAFFVLGNARPLFLSSCNTAMTIIIRPYQTAGLVNAQAWGDCVPLPATYVVRILVWCAAGCCCFVHMRARSIVAVHHGHFDVAAELPVVTSRTQDKTRQSLSTAYQRFFWLMAGLWALLFPSSRIWIHGTGYR